MLRLMLIWLLLRMVCLSDVISRGNTNVLFGQNASLSCALSNPSGVKQVFWERARSGEDAETFATFSERYKEYIHQQYLGKITFTATFNSTSILIKSVTFEDEACYFCSFQVYPLGPKREKMCLTVKGISEITASVNSSSSDSDVTVLCSATGKPTPILQWKSAEKVVDTSTSEMLTKLNSDGSTTTTSLLKLPLAQFNGKYLECVGQSDDIEERYQISLLGEDDEDKNATIRNYIITILLMLIVSIVLIAIYVYVKLKGKQSSNNVHLKHEP